MKRTRASKTTLNRKSSDCDPLTDQGIPEVKKKFLASKSKIQSSNSPNTSTTLIKNAKKNDSEPEDLENLPEATSSRKNSDYKYSKQAKTKKQKTSLNLDDMKEELKQLEDPPSTIWEKKITANRLPLSFFDTSCEALAKNLLGKILVRKLEDGVILKGRIVETESYLGGDDKGSNTYEMRVTTHNLPMYMQAGTLFVYMTYGMYHCLNITSRGDGCAVLIRAVEPLEGIERIQTHRTSRLKSAKILKQHELCSGPSKFCIGFQIERAHTKYSICSWKGLWVEDDVSPQEVKIIECPRIGIDRAGPVWANKPLRYYILGNTSVSKIDKKAESVYQLDN